MSSYRSPLGVAAVLAAGLLSTPAVTSQSLPGHVIDQYRISSFDGTFGGALQSGDLFGFSLATLRDLNGNGVDDLAIGAPLSNSGGVLGRGAVWIAMRKADGTLDSQRKISSGLNGFPDVLANNMHFGISVAGLGDVNGDGVDDLAVGADPAGMPLNSGMLWILFLQPNGEVAGVQQIADGVGGLELPGSWRSFGTSLTGVGDIDGNGVPDLAVGYDNELSGGGPAAGVALLRLDATGNVLPGGTSVIDASVGNGLEGIGFGFGNSIASLGDVDGNGIVDLAVGERHGGQSLGDVDLVWIVFLGPGGTVIGSQPIGIGVGGLQGFPEPKCDFGASVAALGDIDADGVPDLVVGSASAISSPVQRGLWFLTLDATGQVRTQRRVDIGIGGMAHDDDGDLLEGFGFSVACLGDSNGDGVVDVVAGEPYDAPDQFGTWIGSVTELRLSGSTWQSVGGGLAGSGGLPQLIGAGTMLPSSPFSIDVYDGAPLAPAWLVLGATELSAPFKQGVLVPFPDVIGSLGTLDAAGSLRITGSWPVGFPDGFEAWAQLWIVDAGAGPGGYAATNGLRLRTPSTDG